MNEELRKLSDGFLDGYLETDQFRRLEELLQSDLKSKREFVEHIVLHGELGLIAEELCCVDSRFGESSSINRTSPQVSAGTDHSTSRTWWQIGGLAIAVSLLAAALTYNLSEREPRSSGEVRYELEQFPIRTIGYTFPQGRSGLAIPVRAGTIGLSVFATRMTEAGGVEVNVSEGSQFGFASDTLGLLFAGSVRVSANDPNSRYAVEIGDHRILSQGSQFELMRSDSDRALITVKRGRVEIQSRVPHPRLRWSFDDAHSDDLPILLRGSSSRVEGLIGIGALQLADERGTYAEIIGGSEPTVGSGMFALSGGITIEAVIISNWNAEEQNNDVIFRKEDGPNRILLSFQNNQTDYEIPVVEPGPVLSFGIYLEGLGYSELDMPLDGRNGRPAVDEITDGKPHHIAATYDSFTGMKAIAVDGRICFSHQFPIGHCMRSGGPKPAMIGGWRKRESFSGVIDELAIYDFALSPEQISKHHQLAQQRSSWFSESSSPKNYWETVETIEEGASVWLGSHDNSPRIN